MDLKIGLILLAICYGGYVIAEDARIQHVPHALHISHVPHVPHVQNGAPASSDSSVSSSSGSSSTDSNGSGSTVAGGNNDSNTSSAPGNNNNNCINVKPIPLQNVEVLMGDYHGVTLNSTHFKVCENVTYSSSGFNTFNIQYHMLVDGKWIALSGKGTMFAPGKNHAILQGEPELDGVYIFIGTDCENYFVLYSCINNTPRVAIETKSVTPSTAIIKKAYEDIYRNGMDLSYINTGTNNC